MVQFVVLIALRSPHQSQKAYRDRCYEVVRALSEQAVTPGLHLLTSPSIRLMSDYEVTLVNDSMQEFYVWFYGPTESAHVPESHTLRSHSRIRGRFQLHSPVGFGRST